MRILATVLLISAVAYGQCGATAGGVVTSNAGCGRTGSVTPLTSPSNLAACNTTLAAGNHILTQNIGSDASATCLATNFPAGSVNIDLGGFTVTGLIDISGTNQTPNLVQNGVINCITGPCLNFPTQGSINHLTITATAPAQPCTGLQGINVNGNESTALPIQQLKIFNNTITVGECDLAHRTQAVRADGSNGTNPLVRSISIEAYNNDVTCSDNASACQGFELFDAQDSRVHNNKFTLPNVCTQCEDPARAVIFDQAIRGEFDLNYVTTLGNRAVRVRDYVVGLITIHDNAFLHITTPGRLAAIHTGDNDQTISPTTVDIHDNTFELGPSGNGVISPEANSVNVHNNTVTCYLGDCSAVGYFAFTDVTSVFFGQTGTTITVSNNNVAALTAAGKPAVEICGVPGNALYACTAGGSSTTAGTICNSGTTVGNGTITLVNVCGSHVINSKPGGGRIISFVPDYQYAGY